MHDTAVSTTATLLLICASAPSAQGATAFPNAVGFGTETPAGRLDLVTTDRAYVIEGPDFRVAVDRENGAVTSCRFADKEMLSALWSQTSGRCRTTTSTGTIT